MRQLSLAEEGVTFFFSNRGGLVNGLISSTHFKTRYGNESFRDKTTLYSNYQTVA